VEGVVPLVVLALSAVTAVEVPPYLPVLVVVLVYNQAATPSLT